MNGSHVAPPPARSRSATVRIDSRWAVVLAAGDGTRLRPLTRLLHGDDVPKQFAVIDGERSLLQATLERIAPRFPRERTLVVVGRGHEAVARAQLTGFPGVELIVQPANLGTGPGILLPLAHILAEEPGACVAVFPSDHAVARPEPLLASVDMAIAECHRFRLTLIGVEATRPETEFGWIVPEHPARIGSASRIQRVRGFVEKPDRARARALEASGALWNTFIGIGEVAALWTMGRRLLPEWSSALEAWLELRSRGLGLEDGDQSPAAATLELAYAQGRPADWSRDVLARADGLAVVATPDCGWNDWGSPERVLASFADRPERLPTAVREALVAGLGRSHQRVTV